MKQYLDVLKEIYTNGIGKIDRTKIGTISQFGKQMRFDLSDGFPLVTTKKTFLRGIAVELIWIIRGETNIKYLIDRNVHIWDEWPFQNYIDSNNLNEEYPKYSDEWLEEKKNFINKIKEKDADDEFVLKWGDLGPVYGKQWRNSQGIDQLQNAINLIKTNPTSRRIIVDAWNPSEIEDMQLPPCHMFYQFNVDTENNKLNLLLYQRSADMFLGVPFNIASYSILLMLVAELTGLKVGEFVHTIGDAHIYNNHFDQVETQLERTPVGLPELLINKDINTLADIESLEWSDFQLIGYNPMPRIKAPVAV